MLGSLLTVGCERRVNPSQLVEEKVLLRMAPDFVPLGAITVTPEGSNPDGKIAFGATVKARHDFYGDVICTYRCVLPTPDCEAADIVITGGIKDW
ncbi:MAG: hypothetical protein AAF514_02220 [Verrucomicrobiota bacterium]